MSRSRPAPGARTWIGVVVVVALAAVVAVLAALAMQRVGSAALAPSGSEPAPSGSAGTSGPGEPLPTAVTPSALDAPAPVPRADERFIAAAANDVMWRGTAGSCADGTAPVIERSADAGATWTDVTPAYRGITQLAGLDAFADVQAQIVATVLDDDSDGDACDPRAMRTFSDGAFWSDYPDVLAASSHLAGADVATPGGPVAPPCDEPRSVRAAGDVLALVCDGSALTWSGSAWDTASDDAVIALAPAASGLYIAHLADDCDGVEIARATGSADAGVESIACEEGADPAAPLALDVASSQVVMWTGDDVLVVPTGEGDAP